MLFLLSCHRYYTAGSGIPQAVVHRGLHLSVTIFVLFMSFPAWGRGGAARLLRGAGACRPGPAAS